MGFYGGSVGVECEAPAPLAAPAATLAGRRLTRPVRTLLGRVRLGQDAVLSTADCNTIIATIDATGAKAVVVTNFKDAHLTDLPLVLGAKLDAWNSNFNIADFQQTAVQNLYDVMKAGDCTWNSQKEGAFTSWKYAIEQLYGIVQSVGGAPATPPAPPPTTPPPGGTTTTPKPATGGFPWWGYVGIAIGGVGLIGGVSYAISMAG